MRKNLFKKAAVVALSSTMLLGATACGGGGNTVSDTDQTLEVYVFDQGYGTQWCYDIAEEFKKQDWVKADYPNLNIIIKTNDVSGFAKNQLEIGSKKNTYDLLFGAALSDYAGGTEILNLTDSVYNAKLPNETLTYGEKLKDSVKANFVYRDRTAADPIDEYYMVPFQGGQTGILYNADRLASFGIEVPRTTNELYEACVTVKKAGEYPIIQSDDAPYWTKHLMQVWWAQYEGVEGYNNFYEGYVVKDGFKVLSNEIFQQKGRLESLKVFEKMLKSTENKTDTSVNFIHPSSFGSNNFMVQQTAFLKGTGVFHVNGDWFDDEMKEMKADVLEHGGTDYTIKMLRTPIISSIIEKCPDKSIADDAELSALIKAIDENKTDLKGEGYEVTQKDFNKILEARFIVDGTSGGVSGVIPAYAKGKDIAVDFVRFMGTDIGLGTYAKATLGATLDFEYDATKDESVYNNISPLNKDRLAYFNSELHEIQILRTPSSFDLNKYGNVTPFVKTSYFETFSTVGNTETPQKFFDDTIANWDESTFRNALSNAGKV